MLLSAMTRPRSSHTATLTFTLSCRAFAIAASTIKFASARVSVTTPNIAAALPAHLDSDQLIYERASTSSVPRRMDTVGPLFACGSGFPEAHSAIDPV